MKSHTFQPIRASAKLGPADIVPKKSSKEPKKDTYGRFYFS